MEVQDQIQPPPIQQQNIPDHDLLHNNENLLPEDPPRIQVPRPPPQVNQSRPQRRQAANRAQQANVNGSLASIHNFLVSWPFNIFFMIVNSVMLVAYGLIINHQNFKDVQQNEFVIDMILDTERVPSSYLWGATVVICHASFLYYKWLEHTLLEWSPHPTQNLPQDQQMQNSQANRKNMMLLDSLRTEHYMYAFLTLYLMDRNTIFFTQFDVLIFLLVFIFQSFILASDHLIQEYNKNIIETQISFSSSLLLNKNEIFQRRIRKIDQYYVNLIITTATSIIFLGWLFWHAGFLILTLLLCPAFKNLLKLLQNIYNFRYNLAQALNHHSPQNPSSHDDQIITKLYINFGCNIALRGLELGFCLFSIYLGGISIGYLPMVHVFLSQQIVRQANAFYIEIDKYRKFRTFLKSVETDYQLVTFTHEEDCAICKEQMTTGRKLPQCNHAFHWYCIIQLIESGSKCCPICRAEFPNRPQRQAPAAGNGGGGMRNIFNFNLGRFISIRMMRGGGQRAQPIIPFPQAVDRIREVFPFLSSAQIATELRQANGHLDQAILNISENIERGIYVAAQ